LHVKLPVHAVPGDGRDAGQLELAVPPPPPPAPPSQAPEHVPLVSISTTAPLVQPSTAVQHEPQRQTSTYGQ
jgi:hypothetical protein